MTTKITDKQASNSERSRINAQAAAWALRLHNGETDTSDEDYLEWLAVSPEHEAAMARTRTVWNLFGEQAAAPEIVKARRDALAHISRLSAKRWRSLGGPAVPWRLSFAAVVLVVALAMAPLMPWRSATETYVTDIGETRIITLIDNSRVSLDAASAIEVLYSDEARDITLLRGQAHFEVARNPARPFRVDVGDQTVIATGTAFNVELVDNEVLVTLIEGEVVVATNEALSTTEPPAPITLKPGQQLVAANTATPAIENADMEKTSAWRQGKIMLDGDELDIAVQRMNRYSRIRLEVGDPMLNPYRISGVFNAGDTDAFVEAVESYFPIEARRMSASSIVLHPRK